MNADPDPQPCFLDLMAVFCFYIPSTHILQHIFPVPKVQVANSFVYISQLKLMYESQCYAENPVQCSPLAETARRPGLTIRRYLSEGTARQQPSLQTKNNPVFRIRTLLGSVFEAELGTRQFCRDNVNMFSEHKAVCNCHFYYICWPNYFSNFFWSPTGP